MCGSLAINLMAIKKMYLSFVENIHLLSENSFITDQRITTLNRERERERQGDCFSFAFNDISGVSEIFIRISDDIKTILTRK